MFKLIIVYLSIIPISVYAQFSSNTVKKIDQIENNSAIDITINPVNRVKIPYFTVEKVLVSGSSGELEESALITQSELNALDNISGNIQTLLDGKVSLTGDEIVAGEKNFSSALVMDHIATPSNPAAGKNKLYFKSDGNLYKLNDGGVEEQVGGGGSGTSFEDVQEVPTGTIDGVNQQFSVTDTPISDASLKIYRNGLLLVQGVDYSVLGNLFALANAPQSGDDLNATYKKVLP